MTKRKHPLDFDESDASDLPSVPAIPPPPPFSCYLEGQIIGFEPVRLYFNFLRPRAEMGETEGTGRLSISVVVSGVAMAERPVHVEWLSHPGATFLIQRAVEAGWKFESKLGIKDIFQGTASPHGQIDPDTFLATLVIHWLERHASDPRCAQFRTKLATHSLAS